MKFKQKCNKEITFNKGHSEEKVLYSLQYVKPKEPFV